MNIDDDLKSAYEDGYEKGFADGFEAGQRDVQPERKKGKWEITEAYPHNVYCSECHHKFAQTHWAVWEDGTLPRNYCPNCGSYNGGRDDEVD